MNKRIFHFLDIVRRIIFGIPYCVSFYLYVLFLYLTMGKDAVDDFIDSFGIFP